MFLFIIVVCFSCAMPKETQNRDIGTEMQQAEDFDEFYRKFHSDSIFQMSRIQFPLKGSNRDGFDESKWKKSTWEMHKVGVQEVDTTIFKIEIKKTDSLYTERIYVDQAGFDMTRTFELLDSKWYLTIYVEKNL